MDIITQINFNINDLIFIGMKNLAFLDLNFRELKQVNGGNVPVAWYMNDATIKANGNNMATFAGFFYGILLSFVS